MKDNAQKVVPRMVVLLVIVNAYEPHRTQALVENDGLFSCSAIIELGIPQSYGMYDIVESF